MGKEEILKDQIGQLGITASEEQVHQLIRYYETLIEKNKTMNLTRITDFDEATEKHFADSLSLLRYIDLKKGQRIIDLGTGAGFPGIPLKIMRPDLKVLMVDSVGKKTDFVKSVIDELKLEGSEAVHGRAEDLAREKGVREKYDYCVSRAVGRLCFLSEYCIPFVKVGGAFVAYKGADVKDELEEAQNSIRILGGRVKDIHKFSIGENERSLVVIQKIKKTPMQYPRKAGIPSKNPL